jgi:hypothetical protein
MEPCAFFKEEGGILIHAVPPGYLKTNPLPRDYPDGFPRDKIFVTVSNTVTALEVRGAVTPAQLDEMMVGTVNVDQDLGELVETLPALQMAEYWITYARARLLDDRLVCPPAAPRSRDRDEHAPPPAAQTTAPVAPRPPSPPPPPADGV